MMQKPRSHDANASAGESQKEQDNDDAADTATRDKDPLRSTTLRRALSVRSGGCVGSDSERSSTGGLVAPGMARRPLRAAGRNRSVPDKLLPRILRAAPAKHHPVAVGAHRHLRTPVEG